MKRALHICITYIGYSIEMIDALLRNDRIHLVSIVTKKDVLTDEHQKTLRRNKIHVYEMCNDNVCNIEEHILTDKVLIYKFGYIIPREVINRHDFFNIHPGSVDYNRGAHPVRWTILKGEPVTCMTLYKITGIDEGYVLCEKKVEVGDADYIELDRKMDCQIASILDCLADFWDDEENFGTIVLKEHGEYRKKVEEKDYTIDAVHDDCAVIQRKIRAVKDFGGAVLYYERKKYRVSDILCEGEYDCLRKGDCLQDKETIFIEKEGKKYALICTIYSWKGIEVINIENGQRWNEAIEGFCNADIFFKCEYNAALMLHGDGIPKLICFEYQGAKLAYVMFENDISMMKMFDGILERGRYFDWTSQYGYGGPLYDGNITEQMLCEFRTKLSEYCANHKIVSQFFRFHPLLKNHARMANLCESVSLKNVVSIDVRNAEDIDRNMTSECRNRVRKAMKNLVEIVSDRGENIESFFDIYNATMMYHQADEYYFFQKQYFQYLIENMKDNIIFFYAKKEEKIISAALFLYSDRYIHYYLGGTLVEYRKYAPFNLLLRTAAYWANEKGMNELLLGGGMEADDSLFHFKKGFNSQGIREFYIGRTIFNEDAFNGLVKLRKKNDNFFNENTAFLIKYKAAAENCRMTHHNAGGGV